MRFFKRREPNVKSLAKAGQVEALLEASQYRDILTTGDGVPLDAGAPIREEAVLALADASQDGDREAIVSRLTEALTDPVDRVRCAAVMTLYRLGESRPLAEAVARLPTNKGQARSMAVRALVALRQPGSSATLVAALLQRDDELALGQADIDLVATLIDEEGTPDAAQAVIELAVMSLGHQRAAVAFRAEELLERLAPASLDVLVDELKNGGAPHRAAAVLGRLKDSRALEPLVAALEHPDPRVRSESCAALGELRDPAAAEPLLAATRDTEYDVRARAGEALDRLGTAAIAVSVASLLRPLIAPPAAGPHALSSATNGSALPEGDDSLEWELVLSEPPSTETGTGDSTPPENSTRRRRNQNRQHKGLPAGRSSGTEERQDQESSVEGLQSKSGSD
jgi:HEAT repeat protein